MTDKWYDAFTLTLDGSTLHCRVSGVTDSPDIRGRLCGIELELLHFYKWHTGEPVERDRDGKLLFHWHREGSDRWTYEGAIRVLKQFCIEPTLPPVTL